jgi:hypothetical protein
MSSCLPSVNNVACPSLFLRLLAHWKLLFFGIVATIGACSSTQRHICFWFPLNVAVLHQPLLSLPVSQGYWSLTRIMKLLPRLMSELIDFSCDGACSKFSRLKTRRLGPAEPALRGHGPSQQKRGCASSLRAVLGALRRYPD